MRQWPSGSLRQTIRKRRRRVGASEPFGPATQFARPTVAAKSPDPRVESAVISIAEMANPRAASSKAARPSSAGTPGPTKIASSVYESTQAVGSANYMPYATTAAGGVQGVLDLAQSAGGARLVAVGDFTSVGTTGGLHGVAIFG